MSKKFNRNTKVKIEDFHQVEVDEFLDGHFLYLGVKEINLIIPKEIEKDIEAKPTAHLVSVYDYDRKSYYKILVCEYRKTSWENGYTVRNKLAYANKAETTHDITIDEFFELMEETNP